MITKLNVLTLFAGIVAGVALVLSCGDDSHAHADAACTCPAAEPPVAGRIMVASNTFTIAANAQSSNDVACPDGAELLSGSCTTATLNPAHDITVQQSGFYGDEKGWSCAFKNNEAAPVMVKVSARCLVPAP